MDISQGRNHKKMEQGKRCLPEARQLLGFLAMGPNKFFLCFKLIGIEVAVPFSLQRATAETNEITGHMKSNQGYKG